MFAPQAADLMSCGRVQTTRWFRVYAISRIKRFLQSKCAGPTAVVRSRRPEQWCNGRVCKEVRSRGRVHGFCARSEGMIVHSISWWCKNGASHRKNFDTPPLIGNCPDTLVSRQIPMKTHDLERKRYLEKYHPWQPTEVPVWLTLT